MNTDDFTAALDNPWWAIVVGVLGTARLARLIAFDDYPPMIWLRLRWSLLIGEGSKWYKLVECSFCAAPYLAALNIVFAYLTDFHWTWWLFNGWLALSYLAAIVVAYDERD